MNRIYADHAATTKMSQAAIDAMLVGNPGKITEIPPVCIRLEWKPMTNWKGQGSRLPDVLGCTPKEIFFTSGGTESDNQAILSAAVLGARQGKKHIISTAFEHHAVLHTLEKLKSQGFEIQLLSVEEKGNIMAKQVEEAIRPDTCLVTVMYANNEIGSILPVKEIGEICRKHKVLFHTDAVQAVGHVPISVKEQNIDLLSLSAHKFHGPRGIGVLYAKKGIELIRLIEGGLPGAG